MSDTTQAVTIICSDCGIGVYLADPFGTPCWECTECGHRVAASDIDLEAGETITTDDTGALAYTQECTCEPHITRMSHFGTAVYCETEQNAYCNFECTCGADSDY